MTDSTELEVRGAAKMTRTEQRQLKRELAAGEVKRTVLAKKYDVTTGYITQFAQRYAREIDEIKDKLDDEFAGLWIADKSKRLDAYEDLYSQASDHPHAGHHEWIKARAGILSNVAKELGQDHESGTTVNHIIVGVNLEGLK